MMWFDFDFPFFYIDNHMSIALVSNPFVMLSAILLQFVWFTLRWPPTSAISVPVPTSAPSDAPTISPSHISLSIEQDRWVDWIGPGTRNEFFFNALNNLKVLSGEATRLRIGADSEDHTNFNSAVQVS